MATVTETPTTTRTSTEAVEGDQRVEFIGIGWEGYEALLRVQGEKSRPQMIYLDGNACLVSPSNIHERFGKRLGIFVLTVVEELDIPCESTGETTFHRHDVDAGVQPDESFYLANYQPIAAKDGKEDIDLDLDPPPDLAIEVVHTHPATHAVEVLRRLGVPEVWVGEHDGVRILVRQPDSRYVESDRSVCLPFLTAAEIFQWAARPGMASMTQWVKELRRWVQEVLVPRVRAGGHAEQAEGREAVPVPISREDAIRLATRLVEKNRQTAATVQSVREEEKRWVISLLFNPPPAGTGSSGDTIFVYKKTGVVRSMGLR